VLTLLVGILLIWLGLSENIIHNERWSHVIIEFGIVLAAFSLIDEFCTQFWNPLGTVLRCQKGL